MNKEALKILLSRYDFKTASFNQVTAEEFEIAKKAGLMFDNIILSHNQAIDWLFEAKTRVDKKHATALFLASLTSNRVEWRCGLSAYVLSNHFPPHLYSKTDESNSYYCSVCGDLILNDPQEINLSFYNLLRFRVGCGMVGDDIFDVGYQAFCLDQHSRLPEAVPTQDDITIFRNIIDVIRQSSKTDTPNDLEKSLTSKKFFKSNKEQRRNLLETLSFCNIIESPRATGYTSKFVGPNKRYRDDHMSDWAYPIRLWRGQYGINEGALNYWFGDFL